MGRYIYIAALVLLTTVSLETAFKFLSTPLTASVSLGLRNPIYFSGWTKQLVGALALVLAVLWLRLILVAVQKKEKPKKGKEKPPLAD